MHAATRDLQPTILGRQISFNVASEMSADNTERLQKTGTIETIDLHMGNTKNRPLRPWTQ